MDPCRSRSRSLPLLLAAVLTVLVAGVAAQRSTAYPVAGAYHCEKSKTVSVGSASFATPEVCVPVP
jgi:hypothetical protein